jgi:hypothetical protein
MGIGKLAVMASPPEGENERLAPLYETKRPWLHPSSLRLPQILIIFKHRRKERRDVSHSRSNKYLSGVDYLSHRY